MTTWAAFKNPNDLMIGEIAACQHMLEQFPNGILSVVSDSYNIYECCEKIWGQKLRDLVINRGKTDGNVLVIRPDSGDPKEVLPKVLEILYKAFEKDCSINSKGYKVLPKYLRLIQGDGISFDTLRDILDSIKNSQFSVENFVFGSGGSLLMRVHRDTNKCAYKCSYAEVDGKKVNVYKDPTTDQSKASKKGILCLKYDNTTKQYITEEEQNNKEIEGNLLQTVFENGVIVKKYTFAEIRDRAKVTIGDKRI